MKRKIFVRQKGVFRMSKFEDMIYGLKQDTKIPDHVWKKYTDTLSSLPDKTREAPRKRKLWPVLTAAALAVSTISVSAAAYIHWSRGLEERLQVSEEQSKSMENSQMTSYVGQSVTQGGVTVTAQQSIVDNYSAYFSFKVEGYQVEDGVQPGFSDKKIILGDHEEYVGGWNSSFYNGLITGLDGKVIHSDGTPLSENEKVSYTREDGSLEFQIQMNSEEKGVFFDKPIHVELKDLGFYGGDEENIVVEAKGIWEFDWVLKGSNEIKVYELNTPLGKSGATVLQAELSPISICVTYQYPRQAETEEPPSFTGVRLKDGTIYTGLSGAGVYGYTGEGTDVYKETVSLERVIDVEQVESLLFVKSYPEEEMSLTEENLHFVSVEK